MAMDIISLRLYPETAALYKKLKEESDAQTVDAFINELLEAYRNPRKIEVSKTEDAARIQALETENAGLLEAKTNLQGIVSGLEERIIELESQLNAAGILKPGQILFFLSEDEINAFADYKEHFSARGHDLSDADLLYVLIRDHKIRR